MAAVHARCKSARLMGAHMVAKRHAAHEQIVDLARVLHAVSKEPLVQLGAAVMTLVDCRVY